jgi:hypothetical protein
MNKLRGPEIKLPEIKAPAFVTDLVRDLRDRHLLPLVGLLLVAIIAVPIALQSSAPKAPSVTGRIGLPATGAATDQRHVVTFADSASGLRDYRRRLRNLRAKDPFKQQYAVPAASDSGSGAAAAAATSPTVAGSSSSLPLSPATTGSSGDGAATAGSGGGTVVEVKTKYASYEIDVRIAGAGSASQNGGTASRKSGAKVRRGLPELTMLPSRKTPAAVFMGVSSDSKKALLLVSSDVKSVFGDARCVVGSQTCQLLALEPGLPETFIYGARGRAFRIEVLKIRRVISRHPHRASLGR